MTKPYERIADDQMPEWYQARATGIGGSEAAAAAGQSEWPDNTPLHLYYRKRGEIPPKDETDAMRRGRALEPVIRDEFVRATDIPLLVAPMGMYRSADHDWYLGSPDGLCETNELLECKSVNWRIAARLLGDEGTDELPRDWLCQVQWYMGLFGVGACHVAVWIDRDNFRTYKIERHDKVIEGLQRAGLELWERIQNGDPPEPNWQPSHYDLMKALHRDVSDMSRIELSEDAAGAWNRAQRCKRMAGKLKDRAKAEQAKVLDEIGEHYAGVLPGGEKMVRRKVIEKAEYTVPATSYVDVRETKAR